MTKEHTQIYTISSFHAKEVCFLLLNPYCLMMCYILPNHSSDLDVQIFAIFSLCYYLNSSPSPKFNSTPPHNSVPAKFVVVLALVAAALK